MAKNKKIIMIGLIIILLVFLIIGLIYLNNKKIQKEINIKWHDIVLNTYEEKTLSDFMEESNVELIDAVLDSSKIGTNNF